jgi:hypothetical protein
VDYPTILDTLPHGSYSRNTDEKWLVAYPSNTKNLKRETALIKKRDGEIRLITLGARVDTIQWDDDEPPLIRYAFSYGWKWDEGYPARELTGQILIDTRLVEEFLAPREDEAT